MTSTQPGAPARPPAAPAAPAAPNAADAQASALADQIDAAQRAAEEAARRAEARARAAGQGAPTGVVRDGNGRIVVTTGDGRQIIIDPKAVGDEDEVASMVRTALAPPVAPAPRRGTSGEDVAIVSIIFPCLILIMLIVWRIVATSKRPGAAAAAAVPADVADRLSRIEQAIEAVAIEVERISESERYSARLLTERLPQPNAPGVPSAGLPATAPAISRAGG